MNALRLARFLFGVSLVALLAVSLPASLQAQVGSTTDILTGKVGGPGGAPLVGVRVDATSVETQVTRSKLTNDKGQWTIVFPDGGGAYRVTFKYLGMAPLTITMAHQADEDRLVANVSMSPVAAQLSEVVVRANNRGNPQLRPEAGATERTLNPDQMARLPIDAGDLATLAALAPGVVGFAGSDSTAAAFSVAGQATNQNQITLDGLTFGTTGVPQEAVRSTRVITNTYDVSRGQFSGGQVASTTRSGTNFVQGSFNYSLRDPSLGVDDGDPTGFGQGYTQNQLSGGLGGPLIKNKLFAFGSFQVRRRTDLLQSLTAANDITLERLGTSPDSVARFLNLLGDYGLSTGTPFVSPDRTGDNYTMLTRIDYNVTDMHTLTLRGDWRWQGQDPSRIGSYALPQTGGNTKSWGGGAMATVTSHFETGFINELRAYASNDTRHTSPFLDLPQGRVLVASRLPDGSTGLSTLSFGGNPGMPQSENNDNLELTNELSWLSGGGGHRFKLGALLNSGRFLQDLTNNRYGTFSFNSLADLEAGVPSWFSRTLAPRVKSGTSYNAAAYLGDSWRRSTAWQFTYGLRLEGSHFSGAPLYNPRVDTLFGFRTDKFPNEVHISPRVGFTWTIGGAGDRGGGGPGGGGGRRGAGGGFPQGGFPQGGFQQPFGVLRGGVGEFRGRAPTQLFSSAQDATGLVNTQAQLTCIGAAVPTPNFPLYEQSVDNIPSACAAAGPLPPSAMPRSNVTVFDPSFAAPRSWRASLGFQRRVLERFNFTLDGTYAWGVAQTGRSDLNLLATPRFGLSTEGNRPVYVPPGSIVPATGSTSLAGSRARPQYGQVFVLRSNLASRTGQVTVGLGGFTTRGIVFQSSYTMQRSRDESSFNSTAGNPNVVQWATSDLERRHQFLTTVTYPIRPAFEVTAIARLSSGAAFTPVVGGDVNGDGARNDRAFIYDPAAAPDTALAKGMSRLLARAPAPARSCLQQQMGTVASRNSCAGPWTPSLDLQTNLRPSAFGLDRRLTLSLITVNLLTGIDQLFHGSGNLHGWGQQVRSDPTLLYVRGFDASARRFIYQVNERFGDTRGSANAFRSPFQIALQARYAIGPDPARERLQAAFGRGGQGGGGDFLSRIDRLIPNPITAIIGLRDSIGLSAEQVTKLQMIADSLAAKNKIIADTVRQQIEKAGANPNPAALFAQLNPKLADVRANNAIALKDAEGILTAEQWAKVPPSVKNVNGGRGGQGRPGGPPRNPPG